jgi:hypothetical protein
MHLTRYIARMSPWDRLTLILSALVTLWGLAICATLILTA